MFLKCSKCWLIFSLVSILLVVSISCNLPVQPAPPVEAFPADPPTSEAPQMGLDESESIEEQPAEEEMPPVEEPDICFEDVCFSYDDSIACNINGEVVPASDGEMWDNYPEYLSFTFDCYPLENTFHEPEIRIYPVAEYQVRVDFMESIVTDLNAVLDSRPPEPENVPFLPLWNAGSLFRNKFVYVDFKNGSGIRFLTQFGQAAWPINNQDMFYTFQGLTEGNAYYVTAVLPVANPILPEDGESAIPGGDQIAFSENFETYIDDIKNQIDGQSPENFTPNLLLLDEMIRSLRVH